MLFKEIQAIMPTTLRGVAKMDELELAGYTQARREFMERLAALKSGETNPAAKIFQLMDELIAEYYSQDAAKDIACPECRGGWCCLQLVNCTTLEMLVIENYIDEELSRAARRGLCQRVRKHALKFGKLYQKEFGFRVFGLNSFSDAQKALDTEKLMEHYFDAPCPYFNSAKRCSIYPARPLDCRIAKTRNKLCGVKKPESIIAVEGGRSESVRLMFEQVASDLLMDEEIRLYGKPIFVPLAAWPLFQPFRGFFF